MATVINNIDDFLQALRDNPQWRDEVRKEILSRDLIDLPEKFEAFVEKQEIFNQETRENFQAVFRRLDNMDRRFDRMENDNSTLKGQNMEHKKAAYINALCADWQYELDHILDSAELAQMVRNLTDSPPSSNERRSFVMADLVALINREEGPAYIAAEISFTGAIYDCDRARRNAEFITLVTGCAAIPVLVSIRNDDDVQELIDSGQIEWLQAPS